MNLRVSLCLVVVAMAISANCFEASLGNRLKNMRTKFHKVRGPSYSSASASASASSSGSAFASSAASANEYGRQGSPRHHLSAPYNAASSGHYLGGEQSAYYEAGQSAAVGGTARGAAYGAGSAATASATVSGGFGAGHVHGGEARHGYGYGQNVRSGRGSSHGARHGAGHRYNSVAAAEAEAAAAAAAATAQKGYGAHGSRNGNRYAHGDFEPEAAHSYHQPRFASAPRFKPRVPKVPSQFFNSHGSSGSVSTAAAAAGAAGAAAASSATGGSANGVSRQAAHSGHRAQAYSAPSSYEQQNVEEEHEVESYSVPEEVHEYGAATGTYADDGHGVVTSSYVRSTDNEEEHEDGAENSDHHYKAGSFARTYDEQHKEAYDHDDQDVIYTPNVYRSKKVKTQYNKDDSKTRRESGSHVLANDKYSANFNIDRKKFKENVDQKFHAEGKGVLENGSSNEKSDHEEESVEKFDSRNLGGFVGVDGVRHDKRPVFNPAAAAAASATNSGVSSSTSVGRR